MDKTLTLWGYFIEQVDPCQSKFGKDLYLWPHPSQFEVILNTNSLSTKYCPNMWPNYDDPILPKSPRFNNASLGNICVVAKLKITNSRKRSAFVGLVVLRVAAADELAKLAKAEAAAAELKITSSRIDDDLSDSKKLQSLQLKGELQLRKTPCTINFLLWYDYSSPF